VIIDPQLVVRGSVVKEPGGKVWIKY
jgi:hypothetical protein